jgi:hypothetical protein
MSIIFPNDKIQDVVLLTERNAARYKTVTGIDTEKGAPVTVPLSMVCTIPINEYMGNANVDTGISILPKDTKLFFKDGVNSYYLIEEPPQIRNVTISINHRDELKYLESMNKLEEYGVPELLRKPLNFQKVAKIRFRFAFPYVQYLINIQSNSTGLSFLNMYFFMTIYPISSIEDSFIRSPLTNINSDANVCLGNLSNRITNNVQEKIDQILWSFWNNEFNTDYYDGYRKYLINSSKKYIRGFFSWAYFSRIKPDFIFDEVWETYESGRLSSILTSFLNRRTTPTNIFNRFSPRTIESNGDTFSVTSRSSINIDNLQLYVNQQIELDGEKLSLYRILTKGINQYLSFIKLDGSATIPMKFDTDLKLKLKTAIIKGIYNELNEYLINGSKIEKNKLYKIKDVLGKVSMIKVDKIRVLYDDIVEIIASDGSTMLLTGISEVEEFKFDGVKDIFGNEIKEGELCTIIKLDTYYPNSLKVFTDVKYFTYELGNHGVLYIFDHNYYDYNELKITTADIEAGSAIIYKKDSFEKTWELVPFMHMNGQIIVSDSLKQRVIYSDGKSFAVDPYKIQQRNGYVLNNYMKSKKYDEINIPGRHEPLYLKVGETYIIPDWETPTTALHPKKVLDIELKNKKFFATVEDQINKEVKNIDIIDAEINLILTMAWPIEQEFKDIKVGNVYKFKNLRHLVGFTMKTHKKLMAIVKIIGRPLAIFHDNSTLFLDEAINNENIQLVKKSPSPIVVDYITHEIQTGDYVLQLDGVKPVRIGMRINSREYDLLTVSFNSPYLLSTYRLSSYKFFGIPLPRLSSNRAKFGNTIFYVIPNIYGGFEEIENGSSYYQCNRIFLEPNVKDNYLFKISSEENKKEEIENTEQIAA